MPNQLIFCDTETTGLDPNRHEVWEIAFIIVEVDGDGVIDEVGREHHLVPVTGKYADPSALRMNRFYERSTFNPQTAATLKHREQAIARKVTKTLDRNYLVGVNPSFDNDFLEAFIRRHGWTPSWEYHKPDLLSMAIGYLGGAACIPPYSSKKLLEDVGATISDDLHHTAMGDAQFALDAFRIIADQYDG